MYKPLKRFICGTSTIHDGNNVGDVGVVIVRGVRSNDSPRGRGWREIQEKQEREEGRVNARRESHRCQPLC